MSARAFPAQLAAQRCIGNAPSDLYGPIGPIRSLIDAAVSRNDAASMTKAASTEGHRSWPGRLVRASRGLARTAAGVVWPGWTLGPPDEDPDRVEQVHRVASIDFQPWHVPVEGFHEYLNKAAYPDSYLGGHGGGNPFFGEKALEHYASLVLASVQPGSVLIDVASNGSPFIEIATRLYGCDGYENDLQFPSGLNGRRIGGDAAAMPVAAGFADAMTLQCSYDHFEGDADTRFVSEAARTLRPGGRVVILPLYLTDVFAAKVDPRLSLRGLRLDRGMRRHLMWGLDVRFSRLYDPPRLLSRVLEPARSAGLVTRVLRVHGGETAMPGSYLNFALVLEQPAE